MTSATTRTRRSQGALAPFPRTLLDLVRYANSHTRTRALVFTLTAWAPIAALCGVHGVSPLKSFLSDFGAESRFLLVIPLLVLAEPPLRARLDLVARHFLTEGLVNGDETRQFASALDSGERLRDSTIFKISAGVLVYLCVSWLLPRVPVSSLMPWNSAQGESVHLSAAGMWAAFVSYPILMYLLLLWIWRQCLWTWFLHAACSFQLRLVASHPDRCGGLSFLKNSLVGQMPFSFAVGTIAAGGIANRIFHAHQSPLEFKPVLIAVVIFVVGFCIGPLCTVSSSLFRLKRKGTIAYGALASALGQEFETKWLQTNEERSPEMLEVQDFSATTDLYSVVANVHQLRPLPVGVQDVVSVVISALVPGIPVALAVVPFDVIVKEIIKLVL